MKTVEINACCLLPALLLAHAACQQRVSIPLHQATRPAPQVQSIETPAWEGDALVGLHEGQALADDPGLYGRRDAALGLVAAQTLAMSDDWQPSPVPDVTRWYPVYIPRSSETFIFFRREQLDGSWRHRRGH